MISPELSQLFEELAPYVLAACLFASVVLVILDLTIPVTQASTIPVKMIYAGMFAALALMISVIWLLP